MEPKLNWIQNPKWNWSEFNFLHITQIELNPNTLNVIQWKNSNSIESIGAFVIPMDVTTKKWRKNHHVHAWWFQMLDQVYTWFFFFVVSFFHHHIDLLPFVMIICNWCLSLKCCSILILNCTFQILLNYSSFNSLWPH